MAMAGFIKTTNHRPTNNRPTDPPTYRHTDPPTHRPLSTYSPTHRPLTHRFTDRSSSIYVEIKDQILNMFCNLQFSKLAITE